MVKNTFSTQLDLVEIFSKYKGALVTVIEINEDGSNKHVIKVIKSFNKPVFLSESKAIKELEVTVSSCETEDKALLHKLYSLVR